MVPKGLLLATSGGPSPVDSELEDSRDPPPCASWWKAARDLRSDDSSVEEIRCYARNKRCGLGTERGGDRL